MLVKGNALSERFEKIQEKLIKSSLTECSKTAWLLPNYLAQVKHRLLKKSAKHSDVSVNAYTMSEISFVYHNSYVPSSILRRFSWIPTTGILEWWPKLINRSDLVLGSDNNNPTKPNMSGNILIIFVLLGSGLSVSIVCIASEACIYMVRIKQV